MAIKVEFSKLLDPKDNRLPKKTGLGGKLKPIQSRPLFNPKLARNPTLKKQLAIFNPTNSKVIREKTLTKLRANLDTVNRHLKASQQFKGITFELSKDANRTFAIVKDQRTGEVLRQFPSEALLGIAANLRSISGLLVKVEG